MDLFSPRLVRPRAVAEIHDHRPRHPQNAPFVYASGSTYPNPESVNDMLQSQLLGRFHAFERAKVPSDLRDYTEKILGALAITNRIGKLGLRLLTVAPARALHTETEQYQDRLAKTGARDRWWLEYPPPYLEPGQLHVLEEWDYYFRSWLLDCLRGAKARRSPRNQSISTVSTPRVAQQPSGAADQIKLPSSRR